MAVQNEKKFFRGVFPHNPPRVHAARRRDSRVLHLLLLLHQEIVKIPGADHEIPLIGLRFAGKVPREGIAWLLKRFLAHLRPPGHRTRSFGKTTFLLHYARYLIGKGLKIGILVYDHGAVNVDLPLLQELLPQQSSPHQ